ncbi:MAG: class D sortase [Acidobacteriota bacterium]
MTGQRKPRHRIAEKVIGIASSLLMVTGAVLIGVYLAARADSVVMSRIALYWFSEAQQNKPSPSKSLGAQEGANHKINFSLWSATRIAAYKKALFKELAPPQAVLEIPKIKLKVPVFDGTDDLSLNRGVGWIAGTASLGQQGNVGIAGHRDGFFRGLKDVVVGDRIELDTTERRRTYTVDRIQIVKPDNVQVLEGRGVPTLTLVTCYPFYFVGHAPLRYVVRASLAEENPNGKPSVVPESTAGKN